MTRLLCLTLSLTLLAACGADGPPVAPGSTAAVSGDAYLGVTTTRP